MDHGNSNRETRRELFAPLREILSALKPPTQPGGESLPEGVAEANHGSSGPEVSRRTALASGAMVVAAATNPAVVAGAVAQLEILTPVTGISVIDGLCHTHPLAFKRLLGELGTKRMPVGCEATIVFKPILSGLLRDQSSFLSPQGGSPPTILEMLSSDAARLDLFLQKHENPAREVAEVILFHSHRRQVGTMEYSLAYPLVEAWNSFRQGSAMLEITALGSDTARLYDPKTISPDGMSSLRLEVARLLLPRQMVSMAEIGASPEDEAEKNYAEFTPTFSDDFLSSVADLLETPDEPIRILTTIADRVHALRVEKMTEYLGNNPDLIEEIVRGIEGLRKITIREEQLRQKVLQGDRREESAQDEKAPPSQEGRRSYPPTHMTWGSEPLHPLLREYRKSLIPKVSW